MEEAGDEAFEGFFLLAVPRGPRPWSGLRSEQRRRKERRAKGEKGETAEKGGGEEKKRELKKEEVRRKKENDSEGLQRLERAAGLLPHSLSLLTLQGLP